MFTHRQSPTFAQSWIIPCVSLCAMCLVLRFTHATYAQSTDAGSSPTTTNPATSNPGTTAHVGESLRDSRESRRDSPTWARELYGQAAKALVAKDIPQATAALTKLVEQFPQDEMAPLAAMRLAQCHLSAGQNREAIAVLEKWLPELSKSTRARTLDPAAEWEAQAMLARGYLTTAQYERVLELAKQTNSLTANPAALSPGQRRAIEQIQSFASAASQRRAAGQAGYLREAARLVREKQFAPASSELQKVETSQLGADWKWRYHVLCAQCELGLGRASQAADQLDHIALNDLQAKEQAVVRMLRMEAALAAGKLTAAQQELDALGPTAQNDPQQSATLDLRRAELALLHKDRETVQRLARSAREKYPKFESLHEFDLLLARNLFARIEFDEARQILSAIVQTPPASDPTAVPRAQWLLGESYLLSQDYQRAIAEYSHVIASGRALVWTESALMQRGKCYEMLGQSQQAQDDYNRLNQEFPASSLQAEAKARLAQLTTGSVPGGLK